MTPALLTRMCSGPSQPRAKASTDVEVGEVELGDVSAPVSVATFSPASASRAAIVTSAPALGQRAGGLDADARTRRR